MTTSAYNRSDVESFRDELRRFGVKVTAEQAWDVLRTVGDRGVAFDAMLLARRPAWLEKLAGKAQ